MSQFVINAPQENDLEDLAQLHFYMWNEFYKEFLPDAYSQKEYPIEKCRKIQKKLLESCQNPQTDKAFIARDQDNKIAGICYVGQNRIHNYDLDIEGIDTELHRLYIWPEYRSRGLGQNFLMLAKKWLEENHFQTMFAWSFDLNPYHRFHLKHNAFIVKQMPRDYAGTILNLTAYGWKI